MSPPPKSYLACHQSHITPLLKLQKTSVNSLKFQGIAFRIVIKGFSLVNTRNLTTVTVTTESTKNKREINYGKSTWI